MVSQLLAAIRNAKSPLDDVAQTLYKSVHPELKNPRPQGGYVDTLCSAGSPVHADSQAAYAYTSTGFSSPIDATAPGQIAQA